MITALSQKGWIYPSCAVLFCIAVAGVVLLFFKEYFYIGLALICSGLLAFVFTLILISLSVNKFVDYINEDAKKMTNQIDEFANRNLAYINNVSVIDSMSDLQNHVNECIKSFTRYSISLNPESYTYDATRYIKNKKTISEKDFKRLIPIEIERNNSFRFAVLYIDVVVGEATETTMNILKKNIYDVFGDCLIGLLGQYTYGVLLYNIGSVSILDLGCNELIKSFHEVVIHKEDDQTFVNYCKIGASIYPNSNVSNLINDAKKACKESNEKAVVYFPTNFTISSRQIRTELEKARLYSLMTMNFEKDLASARSVSEREEVATKNISIFAETLGFESCGVIAYDNSSKTYKCDKVIRLKEGVPSFDSLQFLDSKLMEQIYELTSKDIAFFNKDCNDIPLDLKNMFKSLNIASFFIFKLSYLNIKSGLLFFLSSQPRVAIPNEEISSMFLFSFIFRSTYFTNLKLREIAFKSSLTDSLAERNKQYLYSIDKNTHAITYMSNNLKAAFPNVKEGDICYKKLRMNHDHPCSHCPLVSGIDKRVINNISNDLVNISVLNYTGRTNDEVSLIIERDDQGVSASSTLLDPVLHIQNKEALDNNFVKTLRAGNSGIVVGLMICDYEELKNNTEIENVNALLSLFLKRLDSYGMTKNLYYYGDGKFMFILDHYNMVKTYDFIELCESISSKAISYNNKNYNIIFNYCISSFPSVISSISSLESTIESGFKKITPLGKNILQIVGQKEFRSANREKYVYSLFENATKTGKLGMAIQPIFDKNKNIVSGECLARLTDELRGPIAPNEFVPLAIKNHAMFASEMAMLKSVGEMFNVNSNLFRVIGLKSIHINLSLNSIMNPDLITTVKELIRIYRFDKGFIGFELRADTVIDNLARVNELYEALSKLGVKFYIDNVYSAMQLSKLKDCLIKSIKIDRTTVNLLMNESNQFGEFARIVDYCAKHNISIIAEGIEDSDQFEEVKSFDVQQVQGYYFAKPMDEKKFIEYINYSN